MGDRWVPSSSGASLPSDALLAGIDTDGSAIYCGRAEHCGEFLPAKVIPSKNIAYVCYDGEEHMKNEFEVLCGNYRWEPASNGDIVDDAMAIGRTKEGELLYFGRGTYEGSITPGKIHKSHGCMYIPYDGQEIALTEYEVLVRL